MRCAGFSLWWLLLLCVVVEHQAVLAGAVIALWAAWAARVTEGASVAWAPPRDARVRPMTITASSPMRRGRFMTLELDMATTTLKA